MTPNLKSWGGEDPIGEFRVIILFRINDLSGAQSRNRTSDTRIFNPLLYQLSYLGTEGVSARPGVIRRGEPACPEGFRDCGRSGQSVGTKPRIVGVGLVRRVLFLGRNGVGAGQPAAKVDIGAALRTEGAVFRISRFLANRTTHGSFFFKHAAKGKRSRFLCSSKLPNGVQPARLVSAASPRKAAFNCWSSATRSRLDIGAKSTVT